MGRLLRPGPATLAGLRWLATVGPAPMSAWRVAMGWGASASFSHAARLSASGWVARRPMARGAGSLLYVTRAGVRVADVPAVGLASAPAPTSWAHHEACAWVAAWLTARGRRMTGPRELLLDASWRGELEWIERGGLRRRGHRPDLLGGLPASERPMPIEVELAGKSQARLRAVLSLYASWIADGRTPAVIYACASPTVAQHVRQQAAEVGLTAEQKTLRIELLDTIRATALTTRAQTNALPRPRSAGEPGREA